MIRVAHRLIVLPAVLALASLGALAPQAHATHAAHGGFELVLGKKSKHGSISVRIGGDDYGHRRRSDCEPRRVWVPGHYEVRCERVWVPGACERVWVPPVYQWRHDSCGRAYQVLVCDGYWKTVEHPGRWENREVKVWVEGCWR